MKLHYSFANGDRFFRHVLGIRGAVVGDGREELLFVLAIERRLTGQHLVDENLVCQSATHHYSFHIYMVEKEAFRKVGLTPKAQKSTDLSYG